MLENGSRLALEWDHDRKRLAGQTYQSVKASTREKMPYEVQPHNIIVALCSIEFDRKTTRIASRIWKFSAKGNSREANENWGLLAGRLQEVGFSTCLR